MSRTAAKIRDRRRRTSRTKKPAPKGPARLRVIGELDDDPPWARSDWKRTTDQPDPEIGNDGYREWSRTHQTAAATSLDPVGDLLGYVPIRVAHDLLGDVRR